MKIVYIHGLNSTHLSMGYISKSLPDHEQIFINYNSQQPLDISINNILNALPKDEFSLIGHSLGGVISAVLADELRDQIKHLVTISAPHGGSRAARILKWFPGSFSVLSDVTPESPIIQRVSKLKLELPTLSIISTGGHLPTSPEKNDSIVAVSSQKALRFGKKIEINANHFEILQDDRTVRCIKRFIFPEIK